jgi:Xaa-Pro aminopeptidase
MLLLEPDRATLVADNLVLPDAERAHVDECLLPTWYEGLRSAPHRAALTMRTALEFAARISTGRIGVEFSAVPAGLVEGLRARRAGVEWLDLDPILRPMRRAKDPDELALVCRSIQFGEVAMLALRDRVEPGMTEFDAYRAIERAVLEVAGGPVPIYGDFVSGPRTLEIGGPPSGRTIKENDLFLLDCSVVVNAYRGDFANTICVGGAPAESQVQLADACVSSMAIGEAMLRPGASCRQIDAAVRGVLPYRRPSHIGHGLGLGHPEPPYIVPESDDLLVAGDVVTLEPGQYVGGIGGMRFERNYLITADGFETLSNHKLGL